MSKPNIVRISPTASFFQFNDENGDAEKKVIVTHVHQGDNPVFQAIWLIAAEKIIIEASGNPLVTIPAESTIVNGKARLSDVFADILTVFGL